MKEEIVNIPDEIFRRYILKILFKNNCKITKNDCSHVKNISCWLLNIENITGIEYFTNLEVLLCDGRLTYLDLSKNTNLEFVSIRNNKLTTLDVSNNKKLEILYCSSKTIKTVILNNNIIKIDDYKSIITNFKELTILI